MILFWGLADDPPLRAVLAEAASRALAHCFVDQLRLEHYSLSLSCDRRLSGTLTCSGQRIDLAQITAAYIRPNDAVFEDDAEASDPARAAQLGANQAFEAALMSACDIAPWRCLNPPSAMASNGSKPYQLQLLRGGGFLIPDTLITSDVEAALAFCAKHGKAIYKSISSVRSVVSLLDTSDSDRLVSIAHFPTQLQQYIAGVDVRVHVVGSKVFACRIDSPGIDYRYSAGAHLTPLDLPDPIAAACIRATADLGLSLSGIDLRLTPGNEWYLLEVNPSPGFTYFAQYTGQPIAEAIVDYLAGASP